MLQLQFCGTCAPKVCAACNQGNGVCRICQATLCPTCTQLAQLAAMQAQPPAAPTVATGAAHNAQAQTATTAKRTRHGVNSQYQRLNGTIALRGFAQALGLRTGWKGKAYLEKACAVLALFGFAPVASEIPAVAAENVRRFKESVKTCIADGCTKGFCQNGAPYKDYKPAALSPELLAQLDDAIMFVQTAKPAAAV